MLEVNHVDLVGQRQVSAGVISVIGVGKELRFLVNEFDILTRR